MIRPSLNEVRELSRSYTHVPVSLEIFSDTETPIRLAKKLGSLSKECFLLESVEGGEKWGRYTFLGFDPCMTVTVSDGRTHIRRRDGGEECVPGSPVEALRSVMAGFRVPRFDDLPRFMGGAVGYFGYDMIRYIEKLPGVEDDGDRYPDCGLMIADKLIAFDSVRQKIRIIVCAETDGDLERNYNDAVAAIGRIETLIHSEMPRPQPKAAPKKPEWKSRVSKIEFEKMVTKAKEHIRDGDIFQVVLSQRFRAELKGSLLNVYRMLRVSNPSPYMYYLKLDDIELAGASPETLLRLENGVLETCPIAGSRPRGRTEGEDRALEAELRRDEKELAEHNMLVDLGRNDIGRVSRFGSVKVREYAGVVRYSHIMHLKSLVTGELAEGRDAFDALFSVLPAGTLSGAPKVKAMELIDRYENLRRGPYGGAVGYIGFDGNLDVCINIRTIVKKGSRAYVQAGAGIVADSVPETEFYETMNKAKAVLLAAERADEIR